MNPIIALICIWSFLFSIYYLSDSIKSAIDFNIKKFWYSVCMFIPYSIIWIDAFLRIFSINHTGLW